MKFQVKEIKEVEVRYLAADCGVLYWEDATVNDVQDEDGNLIPLREGDSWKPLIEIDTGVIVGWPSGVVADIHYKVCDAGTYKLLDADKNVIKEIDGYVPEIMSPGGAGYGDYVIMSISGDGKIEQWRVTLDEFGEVDD